MNAKQFLIIITLLSSFIFTACATPTTEAPKPTSAPMATAAVANSAGNKSDTSADMPQMIIRNADLTLIVKDTDEAVKEISQLAVEFKGYVVSVDVSQNAYSSSKLARINLRIPSEKLDQALERIRKLAVEIKNEKVSGTDVTADYVDLKSRLGNLEKAEKQLQTIMDNANRTEDVMNVYRQLVSTREQIEVIKGRMKYYEESAALSSISLDLSSNISRGPVQLRDWQPQETSKRAVETSATVLQYLGDFLINFFIVCMPPIVILGMPLYFLVNYMSKRTKQNTKP